MGLFPLWLGEGMAEASVKGFKDARCSKHNNLASAIAFLALSGVIYDVLPPASHPLASGAGGTATPSLLVLGTATNPDGALAGAIAEVTAARVAEASVAGIGVAGGSAGAAAASSSFPVGSVAACGDRAGVSQPFPYIASAFPLPSLPSVHAPAVAVGFAAAADAATAAAAAAAAPLPLSS